MTLTVKRLFDAFKEYPDELRVCREGKIDILYSDRLSMEIFVYNNAGRKVEDFMIDFDDGILTLEITPGREALKQYCLYCGYCFDGDALYCAAKDKVLSESELKRQNRCKDFWLSEFGDILTGRQYNPRRRSEIEQIKMEETT